MIIGIFQIGFNVNGQCYYFLKIIIRIYHKEQCIHGMHVAHLELIENANIPLALLTIVHILIIKLNILVVVIKKIQINFAVSFSSAGNFPGTWFELDEVPRNNDHFNKQAFSKIWKSSKSYWSTVLAFQLKLKYQHCTSFGFLKTFIYSLKKITLLLYKNLAS